jgi:hypothetical protein
MTHPHRRRTTACVAALTVLAAVAACSPGDPRGASASRAPASPTTGTVPAPSRPAPALPPVEPYQVWGGEPAADTKRAAVAFLESFLDYDDGGGAKSAVKPRLTANGLPARLADQAGPLLSGTGAQAVEVVYPQLGGLRPDAASVMAVIRLHRLQQGRLVSTTRTIDLRLSRGPNGWRVSEIAFSGGELTAATTSAAPTDKVIADVLADPRITMSDTSRDEVRAGVVDVRVLRLLLDIAKRWPVAIAVFGGGHPHNVFGTDRVSNHTRGRAVDLWAVDGTDVARQRGNGTSAARDLIVHALRAGATEVGGPWALSAGGRSSFTNTLHEDHIHIGFD